MKGFTTACCGDHRLNTFISIFDGNGSYRKRDLGTPFDFIINQGELLVWHSKLTGFPKIAALISDAVILVYTDCIALHENAFFATLCDKRCGRYAMTSDGDFEFCTKQLEKIRDQAMRLKSPTKINWHFGTINTEAAIQLTMESDLQDAIACVRWPFGIAESIRRQSVNPHATTTLPLHANHGAAI